MARGPSKVDVWYAIQPATGRCDVAAWPGTFEAGGLPVEFGHRPFQWEAAKKSEEPGLPRGIGELRVIRRLWKSKVSQTIRLEDACGGFLERGYPQIIHIRSRCSVKVCCFLSFFFLATSHDQPSMTSLDYSWPFSSQSSHYFPIIFPFLAMLWLFYTVLDHSSPSFMKLWNTLW